MTKRIAVLGGSGALLLLTLVIVLTPGRAAAHGVQVDASPQPNAQLLKSPETIEISFSEPIERAVSTIQVWDQTGQQVPLGDQFFDSSTEMGINLPEELPPGFYTVIWRNLSTVDGHPWSGSFPITILTPAGALPGGAPVETSAFLGGIGSENPSTLESTARWVVLLGSAVMLGGVAYVFFVVYPAARTLSPETNAAVRNLSRNVLLVTGAIAAFLVLEGSLVQLLAQASRLGGLGQADDLLVDTRAGRYLIARQALLAVALVAMVFAARTRGRRSEIALGGLAIASFGVLLTQSLVSHAAASDGPFWTTSIDLLHIVAASLWVGALIHIGLAMPRWLDDLKGIPRTLFAAESFRRFSILAAVSVLVLLTSGVLNALVQFTSWSELWSTNYGWTLIGKMSAMTPLLAVAALNALILQPRVVEASLQLAGGSGEGDASTGGEATPAARLQRLLENTVRADAVLAVVVLVAVAVLIQLQSPRTSADAAEQAAARAEEAAALAEQSRVPEERFQEAVEAGALIVALTVEPAKVGQNQFSLGLGAEFGSIGQVLQGGVRLEFEHESGDVPVSRLQMPLAGSAVYGGEGANLSLPGTWTVTVNIRRRAEDDIRASFTVVILDPNEQVDDPPEEVIEPKPESESIWDWPFSGGRSAGAIGVLLAAPLAALGWLGLRQLQRTRG